MSAILQLFSLLASNVLIFDLGSLVVFRQFRRIQGQIDKQETINPVAGQPGSQLGGFNRVNAAVSQLDAASEIMNMFTRAGMIHFSDNQCKLNPRNREASIAISSILIVGLADVGFHDNQSSCNIPRSILITNTLLFAGTARATGNWWKETFMHVAFSAFTFGFLNATTDNESVHCLKISGIQRLDRHNLILGAVLAGVTGDVANDEVRNKLKELCGRSNVGLILAQMYLAISRDQAETSKTERGTFFSVGAGG
jgi:hypothetical protein